MKMLALALCLAVCAIAERRVPTVDQLLEIKSAGAPRISPDGKWVAYTVTSTDWKQDAFVPQIWLAEVASGRAWQVTQPVVASASGGASNPQWSPGAKWLSFTSSRGGAKNQ